MTAVSLIKQRKRPLGLVDARRSRNAQGTTFGHLSGDPGLYFLFNPRYGMCGDLDAYGEQAVLLQFVELGLAESGSIDDLWSRSRRVDGMQCP